MRSLFQVLNKGINAFILVLLTGLVLVALLWVYDESTYFEEASASKLSQYKPSTSLENFQTLKAENPDTIGWLTVEGTGVDYPLVQHPSDNNYYVSHNVYGEGAAYGSIFLDVHSGQDFSDFNTLVYGHFMEEQAMFGDLQLFFQEDFFNTHKFGSVYFDGTEKGLTILSALKANAHDELLYTPHIGDSEKAAYLAHLKELAVFSREEPTENDRLVLLSSCAEDTNGRYVLLCKLTDEVNVETAEGQKSESPQTQSNLAERLGHMSGVRWAGLLLALIMITAWLYYVTRRKEN